MRNAGMQSPMDALQALITRVSPTQLTEPAPARRALEAMLQAGLRAPDHGRLRPWRFIVVRGEARARLGDVLADALRERDPATPEVLLEKERTKPMRAPLIVVAAARLKEHRNVPSAEQLLSAGAAAQNILVAAHALGYGGFWRTGAPAYDGRVKAALGLCPEDSIVAFLYLGTPAGAAVPVKPLDPADFVTEWSEPLSAASPLPAMAR